MKQLLTIPTILTLLTSCTSGYIISVRQDGSATANVDRDYVSNGINRYYQSDIISNIDTTNMARVRFDISNIDSLGHYLPYHPSGFVQFRMDNNTFTITDGHTDAFKTNHESCCAMYMVLEFDRDIADMSSANRKAKQKGPRKVQIHKSRRQLMKGKYKTDLKITFETSGGND